MSEARAVPPPDARGREGAQRLLALVSARLLELFLVVVILFPAMFRGLKVGLLAALFTLAAAGAILPGGRAGLHPLVLRWGVFFVGWGALFTLVGLLNHAPGATESLVVYVLAPVAYLGFVALTDRGALLRVDRLLVVLTLVIALLVVVKVLAVFGLELPVLAFIVDLYPEAGFATATDFAPRVLSNLLFLAPYTLLSLLATRADERWWWRAARGVAGFAGLFAVLIAGRNAILLVVLLAPLIFLGLTAAVRPARARGLLGRLARSALVVLVALVALNAVVPRFARWDLERAFGGLTAAFDPARDPGAATRLDQVQVLLDSALASPVWGHGLGTQAGAYVRDPAKPWRYEIRYAALLHATGFVGAAAYVLALGWVFAAGIRAARRAVAGGGPLLVMLASLACVLLAEATNAYLAEVGNLWMLFVPLATVDAALAAGRQQAGGAG